MNRVAVVGLVGLVVVSVATIFGRKETDSRYEMAVSTVNVECRSYRGKAAHLHAAVCRAPDEFEAKAMPFRQTSAAAFETSRRLIAKGDLVNGERFLELGLSHVERLEGMGTRIGELVAASMVNEGLEIADAIPVADRRRIFAGMHLSAAPFEGERLQARWLVAHDTKKSHSEIVKELDALAAAPIDDHDAVELRATARHLDAAREGRLSSDWR